MRVGNLISQYYYTVVMLSESSYLQKNDIYDHHLLIILLITLLNMFHYFNASVVGIFYRALIPVSHLDSRFRKFVFFDTNSLKKKLT